MLPLSLSADSCINQTHPTKPTVTKHIHSPCVDGQPILWAVCKLAHYLWLWGAKHGLVLHVENRLISEGTAGTLAVHDPKRRAQHLFLRRTTSKKVMSTGLRIKLGVAAMSLYFLHKIILCESRNPRHVVNSYAYIWFKFPYVRCRASSESISKPQHHTHVHCWTTTLTNLVSKQGSKSSWHHLFALPGRSCRTSWHPILYIHTILASKIPTEQCLWSIYVNWKFNTLT